MLQREAIVIANVIARLRGEGMSDELHAWADSRRLAIETHMIGPLLQLLDAAWSPHPRSASYPVLNRLLGTVLWSNLSERVGLSRFHERRLYTQLDAIVSAWLGRIDAKHDLELLRAHEATIVAGQPVPAEVAVHRYYRTLVRDLAALHTPVTGPVHAAEALQTARAFVVSGDWMAVRTALESAHVRTPAELQDVKRLRALAWRCLGFFQVAEALER